MKLWHRGNEWDFSVSLMGNCSNLHRDNSEQLLKSSQQSLQNTCVFRHNVFHNGYIMPIMKSIKSVPCLVCSWDYTWLYEVPLFMEFSHPFQAEDSCNLTHSVYTNYYCQISMASKDLHLQHVFNEMTLDNWHDALSALELKLLCWRSTVMSYPSSGWCSITVRFSVADLWR